MASTLPPFPGCIANLIIAVLLGNTTASALQETTGHAELTPVYLPNTDDWLWQARWIDEDLQERMEPLATLCFPGLDAPPASFGIRYTRPANSKWDFLGIAAGQPVWIYTDSSLVSLGFAATQAELSGNLTFSLLDVHGPADGEFSMYSGTAPTIHMKTVDGISPADFFSKPLAHTHVNWAFSRKGLWIVRLDVQGTLASTGTPTSVSNPVSLVFPIGDYARWLAARFDAAELANSAISGDSADPDGDGWPNLIEYALGGNCRESSMFRENELVPLAPQLLPPASPGSPWRYRFIRKSSSSAPELTYQVQAASSLAAASWSVLPARSQTVSSGPIGWESVEYSIPADGSLRFFRLMVTRSE